MKHTILILITGILLLMGCSTTTPFSPISAPDEPENSREAVTPIEVIPDPTEVVIPQSPPQQVDIRGKITAIPATYTVSDKGAVGFEPGKYTINNFGVGKEADLPVTLHSDRSEPISFLLSYRTPSYTKDGYATAPEGARSWLSFDTTNPILQAQEAKEFIATLRLPEDAKVPDKWEFWIAIKEAGQTSSVQTEGCVRVFVNMR